MYHEENKQPTFNMYVTAFNNLSKLCILSYLILIVHFVLPRIHNIHMYHEETNNLHLIPYSNFTYCPTL